MGDDQRHQLSTGGKWLLAIVSIIAGALPFSAGRMPTTAGKVAFGIVVAVVYLVAWLVIRRQASLQKFSQLAFAFFVLAFALALNTALPDLVRNYVIHESTSSNNPQGSTLGGTVLITVLEMLIAVLSVLILTLATGGSRQSVYLVGGRVGWPLWIGGIVFVLFLVLAARIVSRGFIPVHGHLTLSRYVSLAPALIVTALANALGEETLTRGLFLQKYRAFFSTPVAILLQAIVFAYAHLGVSYTANAIAFTVLGAFPLGLITGYMMLRSKGVVASTFLHGGFDIFIYLSFLTYVT